MESAGVPREGGPIGCMLKEHDLGRKLVKTMTSALEGASQGNKETLKTFCDAADDFILLLRGHITKENNVLFMIAEQVIPETQKKKIQHDFAEFNQKHLDCYRRYFTMVKKLCERYQLPFCLPSQFKAIVVE
jgi:hemerythrin-like domain-containing protein